MYDWPEIRGETDTFWGALQQRFCKDGFVAPATLTRSKEGNAHWLQNDLLFSQTCGYPFSKDLIGKVHLLGTPCFDVEGCEDATYSSAIVVHRESGFESLDDAQSARLAINGRNSLSGYRCLVPAIGNPDDWFTEVNVSGSHRASGIMVANGKADAAAIDAVCWSMFQRFEPEAADKLRVLRWTQKLPALPYITSRKFDPEQVLKLRSALADVAVSPAAAALGINGIDQLDEAAYTELARF